jgi:hypothetical protein
MAGKILLSTAYLPPLEYFALIAGANEVFIEREENYLKQTYRNRCKILSSNGLLVLSIPVKKGDFQKVSIKDVEIDYSKRWQQVHLRAMVASYSSSPWFQYYYEKIEKKIISKPRFLFDLNMDLLLVVLELLKINTPVRYTTLFEPVADTGYDYRYKISPKHKSEYVNRKYFQVFNYEEGFIPGLSIIDLIFNMGPESVVYL